MHVAINYLTLEQILVIHNDQLARYQGKKGIRELTLLESAVFRPQTFFNGNELYTTLFDKAGALVYSLILNRPFSDGNKRTGIVSMIIFLKMNGVKLQASEFELLSFGIDISEKNITLEEIAQWIKEQCE